MKTLLLLAALALGIAILTTWKSRRPLSPFRRRSSLAARLLAILCLILAMAGLTNSGSLARTSLTVFVADVSESVPRRAWEESFERLRRAWDAEIAAGRTAALVVFGGRPEVLVPPTDRPLRVDSWRLAPRVALDRLQATSERGTVLTSPSIAEIESWMERIEAHSTDRNRAVEAARGLFRDDTPARIILITDGAGDDPFAVLASDDFAVPLTDPSRTDIAVLNVEAPLAARSGAPFDVHVTLEASRPLEATVSLTTDDQAAPQAAVHIRAPTAGQITLAIPNVQQKVPLASGLHRLLVVAETPGDEEPRNNVGMAAVMVTGKPRILIVEAVAGEGESVLRILEAQEMECVRASPQALSPGEPALEEYAAVVLAGVPRNQLTEDRIAALRRYVEVSGGGLWAAGSPSLAGAEGYAGSEIEKLLPVTFLPPEPGGGEDPGAAPGPAAGAPAGPPSRVLASTVAVLFIVDKSGSMAGNSIELVKQACIESSLTLSPQDVVGVLAFDTRPAWILEFTEADRRDYIRDRIMRLYADGSTYIYPALLEALRVFRMDGRAHRAGVRHAILLSDGDTLPGDLETVTKEMAEEGITVTTVCVGSAPRFDALLMSRIAAWGGGRFLFTNSFKKVPQVFTNEVRQVLHLVSQDPTAALALPPPSAPAPGAGAPRHTIPVVPGDEHEVLQGIDLRTLPPILGLLPAARRPTATAPLVDGAGKPVLSLWRIGMGKTAVWTSDLDHRWSPDWRTWPGSPKLFAQLVRYLSNAGPDAELAGRARLSTTGPQAVLHLHPGAPGEPLSVFDMADQHPLPSVPRTDGGADVEIPLERFGEIRQFLLQTPRGSSLVIGAVRSYDAEYRPGAAAFPATPNPASWDNLDRGLREAPSGRKRTHDLSPWLEALAVILLTFDLSLRRIAQ